MLQLELSTNLIGLGFHFCAYHGHGNPEWVFCSDNIDQDFEDGHEIDSQYFWENWDNNKFMDDYNDVVQDLVEELIKETLECIDIRAFQYENKGYKSPRYYNHDHDNFHFDITVNKEVFIESILGYVHTYQSEFCDYLRKNHSSYPGYMSRTSNNWDEWIKYFSDLRIQEVSAALTFIMQNEQLSDMVDGCAIADKISETMFYSEYCSYEQYDDFVKEVADLDDQGLADYEANIEDFAKWEQRIIQKALHPELFQD